MTTNKQNFDFTDRFETRHIGPNQEEQNEMLQALGYKSLDELVSATIPDLIRRDKTMDIPPAQSEFEYLENLKSLASKNAVARSFIGQGYYGTITPSVNLRNVFQNPGWYTQYTPYQAEIAQGRLEALLNFQTMVSDLTGLPIANASLLDEGTAAAESMAMFYGLKAKKSKDDSPHIFYVEEGVYDQSLEVILTRAEPIGVEVIVASLNNIELSDKVFGVLLQYPDKYGEVHNYKQFAADAKSKNIAIVVASDLLALTKITPPGEWGADAVVGNSQRFGVPMGFGGPHAAFFSTTDENKRHIPGRIIGMTIDVHENPALRMALQTREQHIRREKATSNICTAQALLAIMASMYAVYHGPKGLSNIATRVNNLASCLSENLKLSGWVLLSQNWFDTITVKADNEKSHQIKSLSESMGYNFFYRNGLITIALDETVTISEVEQVAGIFAKVNNSNSIFKAELPFENCLPSDLLRTSNYLTHPVFNINHTESNMMRYIKRLENKDLSLTHSMISLGSCTMKLNAATELIPISWEAFANIHPFAPSNQVEGYLQMFRELEAFLCQATGFSACSLQPNSGAQGEYAGLLTIRAYHQSRNEGHRNIALIPSSAHGTNPASAVMAGMEVVVTNCDENGNIIVSEVLEKAKLYKDRLACLMVTYPSTHGVFETSIKELCSIIHEHGGLVYMDGANMNAQVGLTSPGDIDADVCHLNLHKTFAIPHGGGGPGMGPICVNEKLAPFLPGHGYNKTGGKAPIKAVSAAGWGSASILLISYAYIKLLGADGMKKSTEVAILNANYMRRKLQGGYDILYTGEFGNVAHELILDLRPFKQFVSAEDVAKRLMDYGFHAPTLSFPVAGTVMIEPTESESKHELDRFCDAMLEIRKEIEEIATGHADQHNNVLANAPHTQAILTADEWKYPYSREKAAFPLPYLRHGYKFWASIGRVNNAFGDRNLICTCPPVSAYATV